ncbi:hypothetical protein VTK73DRAFT_7556 [Phialemonium thermophilum]|uniref:Uncharacterized protein n=1 Tax=Phialemonium thermophilum TaxID=223376 RepID=A0ABR3XS38_9PEZI
MVCCSGRCLDRIVSLCDGDLLHYGNTASCLLYISAELKCLPSTPACPITNIQATGSIEFVGMVIMARFHLPGPMQGSVFCSCSQPTSLSVCGAGEIQIPQMHVGIKNHQSPQPTTRQSAILPTFGAGDHATPQKKHQILFLDRVIWSNKI